MAKDSGTLEWRTIVRLPRLQKLAQGREESLLGRIPRLGEVEVEFDAVDRFDRRIRVRVGREQHPARIGTTPAQFAEQRDAIHARHLLVDQKERDWIVALTELIDGC